MQGKPEFCVSAIEAEAGELLAEVCMEKMLSATHRRSGADPTDPDGNKGSR